MAGAVAGGAVGGAGGSASDAARAGTATAGGIVLITTAIWQLKVLQVDRETPQRILDRGPVLWSLLNGGMLGVAVMSRIGFWLWYAVPICAFASGSALLGATIYATYAGSRMATIVAVAAHIRGGTESQAMMDRLLKLRPLARTVCRHVAIAIGVLFVITFGL